MPNYIKKCPECGSINLGINKERGEVICKDCGLVIEEKMVDFSQEWREFDSDSGDKKRRTGAPMSYSVDYAEPLIIKKDDKVEIVQIGEFVDALIRKNNDNLRQEGDVEYVSIPEEFEAVSFDKNSKIDFRKIAEVSRHPTDYVYEIKTENDREVKVTGSHSVFTVKNNEIVPIMVEGLKEGDFIVAPSKLPHVAASTIIEEIYNGNQVFLSKNKSLDIVFIFLRVVSKKKVKPTNGFVYDISVPHCENFVGGRGGIFLHNTKYDRGLGTDVGSQGDLFQLKGKGKNKFFRLRKWQYRISTAIERNLKLALAELKRVASYLKLPQSVEEESARIYTLAVQRGLVRGRSMESVVAGALYAACRRHEVPRTLDELSEASGIDKKEIGRTYRFITRELGIRILPSNPVDYIPRFASALKLNAETQSKAVDILEQAENSELTSGRGPTGIAAASLYVAALINNEKKTQKKVANISGVTEVTIRNRYKELLKKLKLKEMVKKKVKK